MDRTVAVNKWGIIDNKQESSDGIIGFERTLYSEVFRWGSSKN